MVTYTDLDLAHYLSNNLHVVHKIYIMVIKPRLHIDITYLW